MANDKIATARLLEEAGVPTMGPVPVRSAADAVARARVLGYPVVLKPAKGWAQVGVWTELRSRTQVERAFASVQAQAGPLLGPVIMERHHTGVFLRVTLVGGAIAAAFACDHAPVMKGDGRRSAADLARAYFGLEAGEELDARSAGILEAVLAAQRLSPGDLPRAGRRVRVGLANQGAPYDATRALSKDVRAIVSRVSEIFPLPLLGIDVLLGSRPGERGEKPIVLEVNPAPGFAEHERVAGGRGPDVAGLILDYLFPAATSTSRTARSQTTDAP